MTWLRTRIPAWLLLVLVVGAVLGTSSVFLVYTVGPFAPNFTMTNTSSPQTILAQNTQSNSLIQVAPVNGFTGIVSMTLSAPNGTVASLLQTNVGTNYVAASQILLGQEQNVKLIVTASLPGNYSVIVTGTSGRLSHSITMKVIARGLMFSVNPDPIPVTPCYSGPCIPGNSTVTITSQNGLGGNLTLSYLSLGSGVGGSGPSSVIIAPGGTVSFTISAFLTPTLPPPTPPHGGPFTLAVGTPLGGTGFRVDVVPA